MADSGRRYRYLGPPEILAAVVTGGAATPHRGGRAIRTPHALATWLATVQPAELTEPFTFVVDLAGVLRLAPRHSEHVACAGGRDVLAAGEITFSRAGTWKAGARNGAGQEAGGGESAGRDWVVSEISNQSTGYCPDPDSWPAVAEALDRAGLAHPDNFTAALLFRRCPGCLERNVVRDGDFNCALCGADLPQWWNLGAGR
ncbi:hypothetical protein [Plantactinospora sp. B5E13]|uniref:hypothetical protein n=1 Tax=unclassified Plantactinospora TaxID=2631981 RepID=UPI00325C9761